MFGVERDYGFGDGVTVELDEPVALVTNKVLPDHSIPSQRKRFQKSGMEGGISSQCLEASRDSLEREQFEGKMNKSYSTAFDSIALKREIV